MNARAWGIDNDYMPLRDVLLGRPDFYRWVEAGPLIGRTLANAHKTGAKFDLQLAQAQHAEMVSIYEDNGVTCHYLDADPVLHRNFFARDSSAMTPWGRFDLPHAAQGAPGRLRFRHPLLSGPGHPHLAVRDRGPFRGRRLRHPGAGRVLIGYCGERSEKAGAEQVAEFVRDQGWEAITAPISREFVHMDGLVVPLAEKLLVACLDALEPWLVEQLTSWGFDFVDVPYREARNLGVNLVALGDGKVLSMKGAGELNDKMRSLGFEIYDPDMSMFTLGGGGVHCLCQALRRDAG